MYFFGEDMMKLKVVYPFRTVHQAITYFINNNPARQRYINLLEPERDSAESVAHRMGGAPADIYAAMCLAINSALKNAHKDKYWAYIYRWMTPRELDCSWEGIATHMRLDKRTVKKYVHQMEDDIFREMAKRELIDPSLAESILHFPEKVSNYH